MPTSDTNAPVRRSTLPEWRSTDGDARRDVPTVVTGAVADAAQVWSPEHLARSYGGLEVSVRRWRGRQVVIDRAVLQDFVATMHPDGVYFAPAIPFDQLPGLLEQLGLDELFATRSDWAEAREYTRLRLGDSMRMLLHWEAADLYFAQLHGRTHIVVEPPDSTAVHYPSAHWPTASRIDVDDPRHDIDFPLHTGAGRTATVLDPGDVLHVPRGWWYQARALGRVVWATAAYGPPLPLSDEVRERLLTLARRAA